MSQQVFVKYNPYLLKTEIKINGNALPQDSALNKLTHGRRLQEWVDNFPKILRDEQNSVRFDVEFYGMKLDFDDFKAAFDRASSKEIIQDVKPTFKEGKSAEDITKHITAVFRELQEGPVEELRSEKLKQQFDNINNAVFPIDVIATMSSGKSTLINALLARTLMPAKNEACTAVITKILDTDEDHFSAIAYDRDGNVKATIPDLSLESMIELNENPQVSTISARGDIPFLDSRENALVLVDTPGPNNSMNREHQNITYRALNNDSNNLILYVLNGTQLSTNDDASLLSYVSEQIRKGGKQMHDRFLFVVNKMDDFDPEEEDIAQAINAAREYLAQYGIEQPQIFPCSAFTALELRTQLKDVDIDNIGRRELKELPPKARETISKIDKFIDYESMHLEQYSSLSPSQRDEIEWELHEAEENGDTKKQALIHCGIYSIELAIKAYVKKYATTKKVKDLVESFSEVLGSAETLAKLKNEIAKDETTAKAIAEQAENVKRKIDEGKESERFKKQISNLKEPALASIDKEKEFQRQRIEERMLNIFAACGDEITDRSQAQQLVRTFSNISSSSMAELSTEMESVIDKEIRETSEDILKEYTEMLKKIDEDASDTHLDFSTEDLIKGALKSMKLDTDKWCSDSFITETIDDYGEVTTENREFYVKTGEEEKEEIVGMQKVKVGTRKKKVGTRQVENPRAQGFFGFFRRVFGGEQKYFMEDIYENEDVYENRPVIKKVMQPVYEKRNESVEHFSIKTQDLQTALISILRENMDDGFEETMKYADEQIDSIIDQFHEYFGELDRLIKDKYTELEKYTTDKNTIDEKVKNNEKILDFINNSQTKIGELLEI